MLREGILSFDETIPSRVFLPVNPRLFVNAIF
jgi:hypothetical protein